MLRDVYVLAQKLLDAKAKNAILKAIEDVDGVEMNLSTYIRMASWIYSGCPPTSRVREFVVGLLGECIHYKYEREQLDAPADATDFGYMLADLAKDIIHRLVAGRQNLGLTVKIEDYLDDETVTEAV
jgi:hypothetical protein